MSYELTKEDYSNLGLLVLITESLQENYYMLMKLEMNGRKDTQKYQKVIGEIKSSKQVEERIYKEIGTEEEKLNAFIDYLQSVKNNDLTKDRMEVAINKRDDIVTERILRRFDYMLSLDYDFRKKLDEIIEQYGCSEKENKALIASIEKKYFSHVIALEMLETILNDEYTCFLSILEQYINNPNFKEMRQQFIITKYRLIFICHEIEKEMINNKFGISSQVYLKTTCMMQLKEFDASFVKELQKQFALDTVDTHMYSLLSNFDNAILMNKSKRIEAILKLCALRAGLLFLEKEDVTCSNKKFYDIINDEMYQLYYPYNSEVEAMIKEAYHQVEKDKTIPIQVSFRR